jgi:NAD(P)-dependent dehydrogenase (short-subunit alcohol dehydrogenase family)
MACPLVMVTGASTGIGLELAKCCAESGFDRVVAADEPEIESAAQALREMGAKVDTVEADLATFEGVDRLYAASKDTWSMPCLPMPGGASAKGSSPTTSTMRGTSLHGKLSPLRTPSSPSRKRVTDEVVITWVKPVLVAEVKFTEWAAAGEPHRPVYLGLREDKPAEEVVLEKEAKRTPLTTP